MQTDELRQLTATVQKNCHISDALYARDYTLCIYLLKMREYYRWEKGYAFTDRLPDKDLGQWLTAREELWQEMEELAYEPLRIGDAEFAPFETGEINNSLIPLGLVYSGGIGGLAKPLFFLGQLTRAIEREGYLVLETSREFARDLTAPPAMALGETIFVRRESIRRMLWEKIEEWHFNPRENAMARAMGCYDFDDDFEGSLQRMTQNETEAVTLHELGEVQVGGHLGAGWSDVLEQLGRKKEEFTLRSVRDHLADCTVTLPRLIEREAVPSLHFYMANLQGMRREVFPSLVAAYDQWLAGGPLEALAACAERGASHWHDIVREAMERARCQDGEGLAEVLEAAAL